MRGEKYLQLGSESHFRSCPTIQSLNHIIWISDSDESESLGVDLAANYVVSIYVIILGAGKSIQQYNGYFMGWGWGGRMFAWDGRAIWWE